VNPNALDTGVIAVTDDYDVAVQANLVRIRFHENDARAVASAYEQNADRNSARIYIRATDTQMALSVRERSLRSSTKMLLDSARAVRLRIGLAITATAVVVALSVSTLIGFVWFAGVESQLAFWTLVYVCLAVALESGAVFGLIYWQYRRCSHAVSSPSIAGEERPDSGV
jgi:hypothetical protein